MFSESSCVLEPPLLAAKLLRKLTGILELPGIVISRQLKLLNSVMDVVTSKCWRRGNLHFLSELGLGGGILEITCHSVCFGRGVGTDNEQLPMWH